MTVVCVGLFVEDRFLHVRALPGPGESVTVHRQSRAPGGKAANVAVAAARLGGGVRFVGAVGADEAGQAAARLMAAEGVDMAGPTEVSNTETGFSVILIDDHGSQIIATSAGAGAALTEGHVRQALEGLPPDPVLVVQGEIGWEVSRSAIDGLGSAATVICDPSPVATFEDADLSGVDILTPNEAEAARLTGTDNPSAQEVADVTDVATVLLTHAGGVETFDRGRTTTVDAPEVRVVDTTGAGDAFNGALAANLASNASLAVAVRRAVVAASLSVSRRHCIPSLPTAADVTRALQRRPSPSKGQ